MPAYISHAIMIEKLYKDYMNDNKVFKKKLDINDLKTYSLGPDLASTSLFMKHNPHREHTQDFFLFMIKYIKDNNLIENINVLALLYGHIAHYFLDINAHPFIYYIEKSNKNCSLIPAHHLIEGYLDSYLSDKILNKDIMMINETYFNKGNISVEAERLLNKIYHDIYNTSNITMVYKKTLKLFSILEKILKKGIFTKKDLYELTGLKNFLIKNKLSFMDLNNENVLVYQNPVNGEISHKSFLELFYKSIYETLNAISEVNLYLYGNKDIDNLKDIFTNLSYDTGIDIKYGSKMIYVKKSKDM